jgi:hypothetical protein
MPLLPGEKGADFEGAFVAVCTGADDADLAARPTTPMSRPASTVASGFSARTCSADAA